MIRAVTEAVQSRTIFVAGPRDDVLRPTYDANKGSVTTLDLPHEVQVVSAADIPNRATSTFRGDISVLLEQLEQAGFEHALVRELDASQFECSVARLVVPGLETYRFQCVAAGARSRGFDPDAFR